MSNDHETIPDGNEGIEAAIIQYYANSNNETLTAVLDSVRERMHADGKLIFPVFTDDEDETRFAFKAIETKDGKLWDAAFTSQKEYEKGQPSRTISVYIDRALKFCQGTATEGFIINPWGKPFFLNKDMIELIFQTDGNEEYTIPDDPITPELLEDGSYLKKAIEICNRNRTERNLFRLTCILRDSLVWIPCNAVISDRDYEQWSKLIMEAQEKGDLDSVVGQELRSQDEIRLVPDILQSGDAFFFPVFTAAEEMGEYGDHFSKVQKHFMNALIMAKNNEKNVSGIVINAFSEPFVIPGEMFDIIAEMKSAIEREPDTE